MKILKTIDEIKQVRRELSGKVGFVPTMGFLHRGHLSLIEEAKKECSHVFVSIFVNPTQFAPGEDLAKYPRNLERDKQMLEEMGVEYLFFPGDAEMYPEGYQTYVDVTELSQGLCGSSRPEHFKGVATVVLKLFNMVQPDLAYFGQKDAQQCAVIRRMVKDLNLDVMIRVCPIVRDSDGLALSSRNQYLSEKERQEALILPLTLQKLARSIAHGRIFDDAAAKSFFHVELAGKPDIVIDYLELVDFDTLKPIKDRPAERKHVLLAAAVWVGKTRLIDNVAFTVDPCKKETESKPVGSVMEPEI